MEDREITLKDNRGSLIKFKLSDVKYLNGAITNTKRCLEFEIMTKNNRSYKFTSYLHNDDDPLSSVYFEIIKYFFRKKES